MPRHSHRHSPSADRGPGHLGFGRPGLSLVTLVGLALLGVPRVVAHDLGWVSGGSAANVALVFIPPVIWLVALVVGRVERPLVAGVWLGAVYGMLLAATHQVLWHRAFEDDPPRLGDNLEDRLPEAVEDVVIRVLSIPSSLVTGLVVGVVVGGAAHLLAMCRR